MTSDAAPEPAGTSGAATLDDLPLELWSDLARAFRRAIEPLEDAELPRALRPFRGWKPDRLLADRPRRAMAAALSDDARLRELLGASAASEQHRTQLQGLPLRRLVTEVGEGRAATLLTAAARWDDLATLGADVGARVAARRRVAAERQVRTADDETGQVRVEEELFEARKARDEERQAREHAERRAQAVTAERDALAQEVAGLREHLAALESTLREERARHRDRLERVRRRAADAAAQQRVDEERVRRVADELDRLTEELRGALGGAPDPAAGAAPAAGGGPTAGDAARTRAPSGAVVPRSAPPATAGRPCRLPPGLTREQPGGVASLLAAPGILLVIDGYNVSKNPRGVGSASLPDQRQWLVRVAAGVVARYRVRTVVVFDSALDGDAPLLGARGVTVDFATADENADERIVRLVDALDPTHPVVVVTSDRELGDRCAALGADVVPAQAFITAVT